MDPRREKIVAEALSWEGTPFHDRACVKGSGVDCANLLIGVYSAVGLIEKFTPEPYSPQWFLHRTEPLFLDTVRKYAHPVERPEPGDTVMIRWGRQAAHGAILVGEDLLIHAYAPVGRVTRDSLKGHLHRVHSYWSVL